MQDGWFACVEGSPLDEEELKRSFHGSVFRIEDFKGEKLLSSPRFKGLSQAGDVAAEATDVLSDINIALRIVNPRCNGFELRAVAEYRDGGLHRTMFAETGIYALTGVAAVAAAGNLGPRQRSLAERLMDLMGRDERVREAAQVLSRRPLTWPALTMVYETVTGLMSSKSNPENARGDYQNLVGLGWLTKEEADRFYSTAAYYRKGHPKSPIRHGPELPWDEAERLIRRLFGKLIDALQPI